MKTTSVSTLGKTIGITVGVVLIATNILLAVLHANRGNWVFMTLSLLAICFAAVATLIWAKR